MPRRKSRKAKDYWKDLTEIELFGKIIHGQWNKKTRDIRFHISLDVTEEDAVEETVNNGLDKSLLPTKIPIVWDDFFAKTNTPEDAEDLLYYYFLGGLADTGLRVRGSKSSFGGRRRPQKLRVYIDVPV